MKPLIKSFVAATMLAAWLLPVGGAPANAQSDAKCERQVHTAEQRLRAVERQFGEHSRQAEARRQQLEEARARCSHH